MLRVALLIILAGSSLTLGQTAQPAAPLSDALKKEFASLQREVDNLIHTSVPGAEVLQTAKAAYIEEFGIVISLEVALERPISNPFASQRSASEVRMSLNERRKLLQEKVQLLLKQKAGTLATIGPEQSIAIVVHLFNPANVANVPSQIVFIARKQDPAKVVVREI